MIEIRDDKNTITLGVVLEKVSPSYWIASEIQDNVNEIIDNLNFKKLLEEIKIDIEETEGIPDIHEEYIIAYEELKNIQISN